MSGSGATPRVVLVGEETARIVEAVGVVAGITGTTPTIVGGLAVLCRVQHAHRATTDLDTLDRRNTRSHPLLEILLATPGAERRDAAGVLLPTPRGPVKVDVIEVSERPDSQEIEDPTDRLYEMSHAWAFRTASQVEIVVVGPDLVPVVSAVAHVAEPGPLVAMKLQAVLLRSTAKEGTDLLDIVTILLDPSARDAALAQLAECDPVIAADAALHSERWFTEQIDRTINRVRAAGGADIGREELTLVADLIQAATRRR